MAAIVLTRGGGWTDRFRRYDVWIDGARRGTIAAKRSERFDVERGAHRVQLRIGPVYSSPALTVDVGEEDVMLACRPRAIPGLGFAGLLQPDRWIVLEKTVP